MARRAMPEARTVLRCNAVAMEEIIVVVVVVVFLLGVFRCGVTFVFSFLSVLLSFLLSWLSFSPLLLLEVKKKISKK